MEGSILARRDCLTLDNGMRLRLLSALEVLQARREAEGLARAPKEHALCSNACLLARALETEEGSPIFSGGEAVLAGLRVEEIAALAKTWSQFNREENPALTMGQEEAEALKKTSLRRGGPAALAGAESFWRAALRAESTGYEGPGLCVVPVPPGAGSGGGTGTAVPRLPRPGSGVPMPGMRGPLRSGGGGGQPRL